MADRFRSQIVSAEGVLVGLSNADLYDERYMEAARHHREAIVPSLIKIAASDDRPTGLNASCLLLLLGESAGTQGLIDKVNGADRDVRLSAMERLAFLPFHSDRGGYQVPLDKAAVFRTVQPLLDSREPRISALALDILERLGTSEADDAVMARIEDSNPETRMSIARWLGRRGLDNGALRIAEDLLFHPPAMPSHRYDDLVYWLVSTLESLCEKGSAEVRIQACGLAARFVRQNSTRSDNKTANHVACCLRAIAAVAPLNEFEILQGVLASSLEWWVRGNALQRLATIEGERGLDRLCDALKDPHLRGAAAKGLTELAKHSRHPRVLEAIGAALETEASQTVIATMASAFVSAGGASRAILRQVMGRADPGTSMMIHWILNCIDAKHVVDQLIAADVTPLPSQEQMEAYDNLWQEHHEAKGLLFYIAFNGGTLTDILIKTGDSPADHADLVNDLCAKTRGAFEVADLHQSVTGDGKLQVSFTYDGKPRTLEFNHFGRYLDLPSILGGLNALLKKVRHAGRFFQIQEEGEVALVIFASAKEFPKVARKLRIPIAKDHDAPRQAGIAYTNHVLAVVSGERDIEP